MFGFPDDSYRSLLPTYWFIAKMAVIGVHDISAAPFRPYPGSELFRMLQDKGTLPKPLDDDYFRRLATTTEKLPGATSELESFSFHMSGRGLDRARVMGGGRARAVHGQLRRLPDGEQWCRRTRARIAETIAVSVHIVVQTIVRAKVRLAREFPSKMKVPPR